MVAQPQDHSRVYTVPLNSRQSFEIALTILEPLRLDDLLTHRIDELVSISYGTIANACHG